MKNNKNNIKQNMLSLKTLQQELEALKSAQAKPVNNHPHTDVAGHDIKGSYINRIYMKSSLGMLWLVSAILSYAHKIPFIKQIVTLLGLWYGRTTWWRILVYSRKIFVVFNAVIGVFVVFKSVGFSSDNILAGFTALGGQYLEILYSLSKRLFNWFFDLFDYKIVPNTPSNPNPTDFNRWNPLNRIGWNTKPMHNSGFDSLRELYKTQDFYKSPINLNISPSSWWDNSYWWYIGLGVAGLGILYLGFMYVYDPIFIDRFRGNLPNVDDIPRSPDITITDNTTSGVTGAVSGGISDLTNRFLNFNRYVANMLNPFNYFTTQAQRDTIFNDFMQRQSEIRTADFRFYPFTVNNPHASWFSKLRTSLFGESGYDSLQRFDLRQRINRSWQIVTTESGEVVSAIGATPAVGSVPIFNVGLGIKSPIPGHSIWDTIQTVNLESKLKSITPVPNIIPFKPDLSDVDSWKSHIPEPYDGVDIKTKITALKDKVIPKPIATSSKVKVEELVSELEDDNYFTLLDSITL